MIVLMFEPGEIVKYFLNSQTLDTDLDCRARNLNSKVGYPNFHNINPNLTSGNLNFCPGNLGFQNRHPDFGT